MSIKAQAVSVLHLSFNGVAGDGVHAGGTVSVPGLQVGDVFQIFDHSWNVSVSGSGAASFFTADSSPSSGITVATTADSLYQTAVTDLSAQTFHLLVYRLMA